MFVQNILYQKNLIYVLDFPDYVPSIMRRDLKASCSSAAYSHFERVSHLAELSVDEEPDEDSNDDQDELLDTLEQNGITQLPQASVNW